MRHRVPELGSPEVDVVYAEEIHVLDMPRKGGAPHAKVEVRGGDTLEHV